MADSKSKDGKNKKKGGGRTTALAGLLAVVAVIAAWLSNCIPGFGIGADGSADGDKSEQAEPATKDDEAKQAEDQTEVEPDAKDSEAKAGEGQGGDAQGDAPSVAATGPHVIKVDARGCFTADEPEPKDCAELCAQDELGNDGRPINIDPTDAPHAMVVELLDCLKKRGDVEVAVVREE